MRGSTSSTMDPAGLRSYVGGPSVRSAAFTVFLETPCTRAISEIDIFSDRRSRRISAQSSTHNTPSSSGSVEARLIRKVVSFRLPRPGQFSRAVDKRGFGTSDLAGRLAHKTRIGADTPHAGAAAYRAVHHVELGWVIL